MRLIDSSPTLCAGDGDCCAHRTRAEVHEHDVLGTVLISECDFSLMDDEEKYMRTFMTGVLVPDDVQCAVYVVQGDVTPATLVTTPCWGVFGSYEEAIEALTLEEHIKMGFSD